MECVHKKQSGTRAAIPIHVSYGRHEEYIKSALTSTVSIEASLRKEALENFVCTLLPDGSDVKGHSMHDTEYQTQIGSPSMKHVEAFVTDTCNYSDQVRLHRQPHNPGQ